MFYGQGHEFPGFSQIIYWGLARVSRVFQMVYWLASAPRPIHSSHLIIVQPPTPPRTLHSHPHARHVTGPPPRPPPPRTAGQRPAARHVTGPPPPHPPPLSRCSRACRLASTSRSISARSTSGGGRFSATRFTPKWKRLRCPGGQSGSAISGRFRMVLRARARASAAPNNPYF
jgi:hypothetical protein